jgi:predicted nucleic acid-binding protein
VSFLLDTNVLSELRKGPRANETVRAWDKSVDDDARFTSIIVIAELLKGAEVHRRKDPGGGAALDRWANRVVANFAERILPVDLQVAAVWGRLMAPRSRPPLDILIAATALAHGFTLVTRNVSDFEGTGVTLLNPWTFEG